MQLWVCIRFAKVIKKKISFCIFSIFFTQVNSVLIFFVHLFFKKLLFEEDKFMFHTSVKISSDLSKISEIEDFIQSMIDDCHIDSHYGAVLCTPLIEAVKNAIIHGNCSDNHKMVQIDCQINGNRWTFSVSDEGRGFSYENYLQQKILGLSHGLSIIFTLCEDVTFQNNGSTVVFCVQLPKQKTEVPQRDWAQKVIKSYLPQLA